MFVTGINYSNMHFEKKNNSRHMPEIQKLNVISECQQSVSMS